MDNKLAVTVADTHALTVHSTGKERAVQKEGNLLRPVPAFIAVDGNIEPTEAEEVTKAASNPATNNNVFGNVNLNQEEQEIPRASCDSSINNDLNQNEYNDMVGVVFHLSEDGSNMLDPGYRGGREDDATSIAAVSTNFSFRKESNNQEEDMINAALCGSITLPRTTWMRKKTTCLVPCLLS